MPFEGEGCWIAAAFAVTIDCRSLLEGDTLVFAMVLEFVSFYLGKFYFRFTNACMRGSSRDENKNGRNRIKNCDEEGKQFEFRIITALWNQVSRVRVKYWSDRKALTLYYDF